MVLIPRCALFKISQLKICADAFSETGVTRSNAVAILQTDKNHCSMLKQAREIFALNIKNYFFVESLGLDQGISIWLTPSSPKTLEETRKLQKLMADLDVEEVWTLG